MKVTFRDHDGKGRLLGDALIAAGHQLVGGRGDVALLDADVPMWPYSEICDSHDRVIVYPHGGGNPLAGKEWTPHPHTVCRLVPSTGQVDVLTTCGYPVPVEVIGWPFSDRHPFRPCTNPVEVLFAPLHQGANAWIPADGAVSNRRIHDLLAELPVNLTVRYPRIGRDDLAEIGITRQDHVTYQPVPMDVQDGIAAITAADVVVAAEGTFPSLAVALGCPTVMTAQVAPDDNGGAMGYVKALSWDQYKDDVRYLIDGDTAATADDLMGLLVDACRDDTTIAEWRHRFVGAPFDPDQFARTFERLTCPT